MEGVFIYRQVSTTIPNQFCLYAAGGSRPLHTLKLLVDKWHLSLWPVVTPYRPFLPPANLA